MPILMPWAPSDFPFFSPDLTELLAVFVTLAVSLAIMVALGRWWQS